MNLIKIEVKEAYDANTFYIHRQDKYIGLNYYMLIRSLVLMRDRIKAKLKKKKKQFVT